MVGRYLVAAAVLGALTGLLMVIANWSDNTIFWVFISSTAAFSALGALHQGRTERKRRPR